MSDNWSLHVSESSKRCIMMCLGINPRETIKVIPETTRVQIKRQASQSRTISSRKRLPDEELNCFSKIHGETLMSDEHQPIALRPHMNIIINSVPSGSREGKHWTLLMVINKFALHFGSYAGLPTAAVDIFCKKHNLTLCHSKFIIQSMRSTQCGLFCMAI